MLNYGCSLRDVNERLGALPVVRRDADMVVSERDDLVTLGRCGMQGDALSAVVDLNCWSVVAHPDLLACVLPRHRIAAAVPRDVGITSDLALLVIHIWIGWPALNCMHGGPIGRPANDHLFMRSAMDALVGDFAGPPAQLHDEISKAAWLAALQSTDEVAAHVLHSGLHLALGLCAVWRAQTWSESPVAGEVQEDRVPDDLAAIVNAGPDGLHPVVENLVGHRTPLEECSFVHAQQCAELLIDGCRGEHPAAVTRCDREAPELALSTALAQTSEVAPVDLCLLARWSLESPHRQTRRLLALRVQPILQNRITALIAAFAQLAQEHHGVPHTRP